MWYYTSVCRNLCLTRAWMCTLVVYCYVKPTSKLIQMKTIIQSWTCNYTRQPTETASWAELNVVILSLFLVIPAEAVSLIDPCSSWLSQVWTKCWCWSAGSSFGTVNRPSHGPVHVVVWASSIWRLGVKQEKRETKTLKDKTLNWDISSAVLP